MGREAPGLGLVLGARVSSGAVGGLQGGGLRIVLGQPGAGPRRARAQRGFQEVRAGSFSGGCREAVRSLELPNLSCTEWAGGCLPGRC